MRDRNYAGEVAADAARAAWQDAEKAREEARAALEEIEDAGPAPATRRRGQEGKGRREEMDGGRNFWVKQKPCLLGLCRPLCRFLPRLALGHRTICKSRV